jgi:DNA primase
MSRITEQLVDEVRSRVDIVELIGARVQLKKSGSSYKACCPFHHEKTPSFNVNPEKQFYHCFGCGESGDVFKFLMKMDGLTFPDAVRKLADTVGVKVEEGTDFNAQKRGRLYGLHEELAAFYQRCLALTPEAEAARAYLVKRKLPDDIVKRFGIGYAPANPRNAILRWAEKHGYTVEELVSAGILLPSKREDRPDDFYDRFKGRLMFPICDRQGRVVAFSGRILDVKSHPAKYVNSPETDIFVKGRVLYALDKAAPHIVKSPRREAIICEGQIDVIRCHACGFETAVASEGTAFTKDHVAILKRNADSVVMMFDGDAAGRKAALRTGGLFLEAEIPVRVAVLPKGDDPDSLLRDKGPAAMQEVLDNAMSITAFQVETLRAKEPQPDTIDAVSRVSKAVLEMLAVCPGAVMRTRLLQEAADLLHLPVSALEDDLGRTIEQAKARASYAERFAAREEKNPSAPSPADSPDEPDEPRDLDALAAEPPPPDPPSKTEYELCELLMECEHDETVLTPVRQYLPLDFVAHPFARGFISAILAEKDGDDEALVAFCKNAEPCWQPLLGTLVANKQKMLSARESTPEEAARDYIRRLWEEHIKAIQGVIPAESTPENDAKRLRLSMLVKAFQTSPWERVCQLMTKGL